MKFLRPFCLGLLSLSLLFSQLRAQAPGVSPRVLIVLDASGSMWGQVHGRPKIEIAREVIRDFVGSLPANVELGLVAYGHRHKGDCNDIELVAPVDKLDRKGLVKTVNALQPKGKTPLTSAVEFAAEKLRYTEQKASVILVTDGEETCDRDPCEAAAKLESLGLDFTAHVIAFDLTDKAARSVECLAKTTGGQFLKADDAASLADALTMAMEAETKPAPEEEKLGEATLEGPATVVMGSTFEVKWTGPNNRGDHICIVPQGADDRAFGNYAYTIRGNPSQLVALIQPGQAELRYVTGISGKVLARAPIEITKAVITLKAAEQIIAGGKIPVEWTGPNNHGDRIGIAMKDADKTAIANYEYTVRGNPALVTAPLTVGEAEIHYIAGQGSQILESQPVKIMPAEVSLMAVETVVAGARLKIDWTGPNNNADRIAIVSAGPNGKEVVNYEYTVRGNPAAVTAPMIVGAAEIRYIAGQGGKTLATRPVTITEAQVSLTAPDRVVAGAAVSVEWTGPGNQSDRIAIVSPGANGKEVMNYEYTQRGNPVKVPATMILGAAEIRYIAGQGGKVLATRSLTIEASKVTLKGPASSPAGTKVAIDWEGPDNRGDRITIVMKGTPDDKIEKYGYTSWGNPLKVEAPKSAGEAEIRYLSGQGNAVLARQPIQLMQPAEE